MTHTPPSEVLPHRPPFLFLDEVVELTEETVRAVRTFRPDEAFFAGHFPGRPIVPGVILLEAMAQAFAYMAMKLGGLKGVYLTGVDRARFRKPVLPGEKIEITVRVQGGRMGLLSAKAEVRVAGTKVADARLTGFGES